MEPLTRDHKRRAFLAAVQSYQGAKERWIDRSLAPMSDSALTEALKYELGLAGGSSATEARPSIAYQRAGLKIWASWIGFIPQQTEPIYQGAGTIKMAREVFKIKHPDDHQIELF